MQNNLEEVQFSKDMVSWKLFSLAVRGILFPSMTVSLISCLNISGNTASLFISAEPLIGLTPTCFNFAVK